MYTEDETSPWYALRLFSLKQQAINDELKRKGFTTFIPMETVDVIDRDNKLHHELRPVVHNLIFVRKAMEESEFQKMLIAMHYKLSVIKKGRDSKEMAEIPAKEMHEFQLMCDPKLAEKKYIAEKTGFSQSSINNYLFKSSEPSIQFLIALKEAFGVSVDDFLFSDFEIEEQNSFDV